MKLATIEQIIKIEPIANADSIELATVLGWEVVVKKGNFNVGDLCVYIPIDTLVDPYKSWFSFLSKDSTFKPLRIRTAKIRGVWSQGLILPLSPDIEKVIEIKEIGMDIGNLIGVSKYQKDLFQIVKTKSDSQSNIMIEFPTGIINKTDEDNLKSKPELINEFAGKKLYLTKKLDGSSMTIIYLDKKFFVCSRNYILEPESQMYMFAEKSGILKIIESNINYNIAIQGEFCGPKINSNKLKLGTYKFYVFNVKNLDSNEYLGLEDLVVFTKNLGLDFVEVLDIFEHNDSWDIKKFQEYANQIKYGEEVGEGIVIRPVQPIWSKILNKYLSCKVINQNYKD
jgi:RNA ligase (TIGR02306 family)